MQMQGSFNANQFEPNQGFGIHPPAQKVPFRITAADIKENSAKTGGYYEVEFTSPQGSVIMRYNIWNQSPKAQEIAHGQLSALCRAVNIYNIDWSNGGKALIGAQGLMDIGYQKDEEPNPAFPDRKGYTELKRVYDMAGNDPSKPAGAQQQTMQPQQAQPQGQPMTQQPGGGWGAPNGAQPQQSQPQQQAAPGGWQPQGGAPQAQPNQPQQQTGQAWQPGQNGGNAGGTPPWGNR